MSATLKRTLMRRAARVSVKRLKLDKLFLKINHPSTVHGGLESVEPESIGVVDARFDDSAHSCNEVSDCDNDHFEQELDGIINDAVLWSDEVVVNKEADDSDGSDLASEVSAETPPLNDEEKEQYVIDSVREWASEPGVLSVTKVENLLHRLGCVFPHMPLNYSTLLACDYEFDISQLESGGEMFYKGIKKNLDQLSLDEYIERFGRIAIDINMDGLTLFANPVTKLWPILGHLFGTNNAPFIIGIFSGPSDPPSVNEYLCKYVSEVKDLNQNGYRYKNECCQFEIRQYILDAPARSFVKCCQGHGAYEGCEKCTVYGEYIDNRVTYVELDAPLRTDESFLRRDNPRHHKGDSPLEQLGTGMITQFRLDPMHLCYAGAVKRVLEFWITVPGPWKLHHEVVSIISSVIDFMCTSCPSDFNRKPRPLLFWKKFKCTELRRLILYDGFVCFKGLVDENIYKNFLLLHCSFYILSSASLFSTMRNIAIQLIRTFICHSRTIYGAKFVVYNIHNLSHLVQECDKAGTLDEFSAFKYENKLKSIKESVRSGLKPLVQIARRDEEKNSSVVSLSCKQTHCVLSLKHHIPNEIVEGQQYRKLKSGSLLLRVGKRDSCFKAHNGDIVVLTNIVSKQKMCFLIGNRFNCLEDAYDYPIPSSDLGIWQVSHLSDTKRVYRLKDVASKCWLMPEGNHFFVVLKFLATKEDDNEYFEVGLASWIQNLAEDSMRGIILWPPNTNSVMSLIRTQSDANPAWKRYEVEVKRYYDSFEKARQAVPKFVEDSNHETDGEQLQRSRLRQRGKQPEFLNSSDEDDPLPVKRSKKNIPPPPMIKGNDEASTQRKKITVRKGQTVLSKAAQSKAGREALMERLKEARRVAKEKMNKPTISPGCGMTSPWKVTPRKSEQVVSSNVPARANAVSKRLNGLSKGAASSTVTSCSSLKDTIGHSNTPNFQLKVPQRTSLTVASGQSSAVVKRNSLCGQTGPTSPGKETVTAQTTEISGVPSAMVTSILNIPDTSSQEFGGISEYYDQELDDNTGLALETDPTETDMQFHGGISQSQFDEDHNVPLQGNDVENLSDLNDTDASHRRTLFLESSIGLNDTVASHKRPVFSESSVGLNDTVASSKHPVFSESSVEERLSALERLARRHGTILEATSSKADLILMNIGRLSRCLLPDESRIVAPAGMPPLPIENRPALNTFESFLGENDLNLAAVCDYMNNYVQLSVVDPERKSSVRILKQLLRNDLAKNMNLDGGNNKISFRALNMYKVFQGTLQKAFPTSDLATAEDALQRWLKDAKWRKQSNS